MVADRYGLTLSTGSAAAGLAYVEGVDRFLAAHAAAQESFDRAIAADPDFALAHVGRARALQLHGRGA
ncbi:MAG TPA: tetratricopeptide repeat protein, partial [Methylomirabilota bacterium]|nr:tetratricopeptide repeat protein [Methylomirabilota bacterium]